MNLQQLDIKFLFFCRTSYINKEGLSPIVLRITYRGQRADVFTGLYCLAVAWDANLQRLAGKGKAYLAINSNLEEISHKSREAFDELKYGGRPFALDELIRKIKGGDGVPETVLDYLSEKVDDLKGRVGIDITSATLQKYSRCAMHLKEFLKLKFKNSNLAVGAITSNLLMDFFYYMRVEKNNSHNTSVNYLKCLKTVLMPAIKNGIFTSDPFYGLKIAPKVVMRGFLSIDEIERISALKDLPPGIEQALDIFLFSCYTGMAYIDVKQFSQKHLIRETDGSFCIHKARQKTGIISIIPLLPPARRILESYSLTGNITDFKWTVISNQKVNAHLKTIAKLAGLKQDLFFHLARHTFATTVTLSNGVPLETVSKMLGHTDIKMTQRYAKISGFKVKEDMKNVFNIFR